MKISKSKQELARIISENGGWREMAKFSAQDKDGDVYHFATKPTINAGHEAWHHKGCIGEGEFTAETLPNWHQTILSREEYFHLYPVPDADGWIEHDGKHEPAVATSGLTLWCKWSDGLEQSHGANMVDWIDDSSVRIIAYRLHKPEQSGATDKLSSEAVSSAKIALMSDSIEELVRKPEQAKPEFCESVMRAIPEPTAKPTIEQLATDYRNAKDYAESKQQEADDAKAGANEALRKLEIAGEAIGLLLSPITAKQEPELVITDWRYLQAGDVISVSGKWWEPDSEYTVDENDGSRDAPIRVGDYWAFIGECSFKFIRRP